MSLLGEKPVEVRRAADGGTYDKGRFTEWPREVLEIPMAVEPLSGKDLERLARESGERLAGGIKVYAEEALYAVNPTDRSRGDWIIWQGVAYEVRDVGFWADEDLEHWEACAVRLEPQPKL